jgi:hypothetical protein
MRRVLLVLVLTLAACGKDDVGPSLAGAPTTTAAPTTTTTAVRLPVLPHNGLAMDLGAAAGVVFLTLDGMEIGRVSGVVSDDIDDLLPHTGRIEDPDLPPLDGAGHWRYAFPEPGGTRTLAYWSGECESPSAWVIEGDGPVRPIRGTSRADVPESIALGWAPDGRAIVSFTEGICGRGSDPGVFLLDLDDPAAVPTRVTPLVEGTYWSR